MFFKILAVLAFATVVIAQHGHQATSYASSNSFNSHTSHDYHHAAPIASYHQAAPIVHHAVHAAPVLLKSVHHEPEHYGHPKYQFKYGVHDTHTHDIKDQEESRDGDVVKGSYSLLQPDGRKRIVHYTSDKHNGFQAHVEYSGHAGHPEVHHKAIVAAPAYYHH
ncbi:cuticle protein 8-like [Atheta coriaria]|uniref:cuticle protein 8-like n=1 Tax=Dalotia coriaria TaxID=877792 RepID=UPI0031F45447